MTLDYCTLKAFLKTFDGKSIQLLQVVLNITEGVILDMNFTSLTLAFFTDGG